MEKTLPKLLRQRAKDQPNLLVQQYKDPEGTWQTKNYTQCYDQVRKLALGLQSLGIKRGDNVGLISENRHEWLESDMAVISLGAIDVPRGCDTTNGELAWILSFSECRLAFIENIRQLEKIIAIEKSVPDLKNIIIFDYQDNLPSSRFTIHRFSDIFDDNADMSLIDDEIDKGGKDDVVTIIFTSGTTGEPKGVMLTNENFMHQMEWAPPIIFLNPNDRWLSILPVWHVFERVMQYVTLASGSSLCYSKPVGSIMLKDMQAVKPTWMASVPRIWESIRDGVYRNVKKAGGIKKALFLFFVAVGGAWKRSSNLVRGLMPRFKKRSRLLDFFKGIIPFILLWPLKMLGSVLVFKTIRQKLGGQFIAGISGGGSLPTHVEAFFQAAGITLLEGYGLTETAPVLTLRPRFHIVPGTIGPPLKYTEIKILDENGNNLGPGETGVLYARGPQIMKGYYKRDDLTNAVIDRDGWLNTGDLAMATWDGEIAIVGRAKDTIVLINGENVEPSPIEFQLKSSPYIASAVVVGQDKKYLGALILPDKENILQWAEENDITHTDETELFTGPEVHKLISGEIAAKVSSQNGFKQFETIARFAILTEEFEPGRELSAKQEVKRHIINELYAEQIAGLFKPVNH